MFVTASSKVSMHTLFVACQTVVFIGVGPDPIGNTSAVKLGLEGVVKAVKVVESTFVDGGTCLYCKLNVVVLNTVILADR